MKTISVLICLSLLSSGCATMSNRSKTLLAMVGTGIIAGSIAASKAPDDESSVAHAAVWGGTTAAVAGAVGLFLFDEQAKSQEAERKLQVAQHELDAFRGESSTDAQHPYAQSDSSLERDLPSEYRSLVRPGKWSIYKVNNWTLQGENTIVHQDKILRIEPAHFQPQTKTEGEEK